jgi:NTE family protein
MCQVHRTGAGTVSPARSAGMRLSMTGADESYSIVLGAGGRPGLAYLAGTLLALELHGFTPAGATSITGTSAGAIATSLLVSGATVEDLAAYSVGAQPRAEFIDMDALIRAADRRRLRLDMRSLRLLVDARRALAAASHVRAGHLLAAFAAAVPGLIEITRRFDFLDRADPTIVAGPAWRIVAADVRGGRHVFTTGEAPLSLAVAASCAVPGLFAPVRHGQHLLVDGGVHSTTNADLALDDAADVVIVLAPMASRTPGRGRSWADTRLASELASLARAGRRVLTFGPSPALRRMMGRNPLAVKRSRAITAAAVLDAVDVLAEIGPRRRLAA